MADNEEVEKSIARGNDWEVVSLTASTCAAAPGPAEVAFKDDDKGDTVDLDRAETSSALFFSRYFALDPAHHENRALEIADIDVDEKHKYKDRAFLKDVEQVRSSGKDEKDWAFKGLSVHDEYPCLHFLDEKGLALSIHGPALEEGSDHLQGLKYLTDREQSVYSSATFSSFSSNDAASRVPPCCIENMTVSKVEDISEPAADSSSAVISHRPKHIKGENFSGFDLPSGAWWKKRAASFCAQAKESNAFWSVFIAAAVMGIVILGQRWQQEKRQVLQLRWHLSINNEVCLIILLSKLSGTEILASDC